MNNKTFSFSNTYSYSHSFTISSTNTNTHTNYPFRRTEVCKGFAENHCQKRFNKYLGFQVDVIQLMSPSTLPGGKTLPGRTL